MRGYIKSMMFLFGLALFLVTIFIYGLDHDPIPRKFKKQVNNIANRKFKVIIEEIDCTDGELD